MIEAMVWLHGGDPVEIGTVLYGGGRCEMMAMSTEALCGTICHIRLLHTANHVSYFLNRLITHYFRRS